MYITLWLLLSLFWFKIHIITENVAVKGLNMYFMHIYSHTSQCSSLWITESPIINTSGSFSLASAMNLLCCKHNNNNYAVDSKCTDRRFLSCNMVLNSYWSARNSQIASTNRNIVIVSYKECFMTVDASHSDDVRQKHGLLWVHVWCMKWCCH